MVCSSDDFGFKKFPFYQTIDTSILQVPGCGKIKSGASSRIVNGNPTPKWYPWVSFINRYVAKPEDTKNPVTVDGRVQFIVYPFYCTASIISERSILTAAHCLCSHKSDVKDDSRPPPLPWLKVVCLNKNLNQHKVFFSNPTPKLKSVEKLHEENAENVCV